MALVLKMLLVWRDVCTEVGTLSVDTCEVARAREGGSGEELSGGEGGGVGSRWGDGPGG